MTQSSRKLDVKDTCIKLIPKYTYLFYAQITSRY